MVWIASWRRCRLLCSVRIARAHAGAPVSPPPEAGDGEFWLIACHAACRPPAAASPMPSAPPMRALPVLLATRATPARPASPVGVAAVSRPGWAAAGGPEQDVVG